MKDFLLKKYPDTVSKEAVTSVKTGLNAISKDEECVV